MVLLMYMLYVMDIFYDLFQRPTVEAVEVGMACHGSLWSSDVYMKAFDNEDLMLQFGKYADILEIYRYSLLSSSSLSPHCHHHYDQEFQPLGR